MSGTHGIAGLRVAVTGAAQGIGLAAARALIDAGASVALGDVQARVVEAAATDLGPRASGHRLDVTDPDDLEGFLTAAEDSLSGLDVLVNNAGIMPIGPFLDEEPALTRRTVEVDLMGVLTGTRMAGRRFARRGSGHVVTVASVMGTLASPNAATYCAAKHALLGFSSALRQEWHSNGVRVSAICPGFVRTELIAGMSAPKVFERLLVVEPEDVADAVVRELSVGKSRTVFVPRTAGLLSRGTALLPAAVVDTAFRLSGGTRVTTGLDRDARTEYQRRISEEHP